MWYTNQNASQLKLKAFFPRSLHRSTAVRQAKYEPHSEKTSNEASSIYRIHIVRILTNLLKIKENIR